MFGLIKKLREKDEEIEELGQKLEVAEAVNKLNDRYCQELIQNLENEKKKRKAECEEWSEKHSALYEKYLNLLERYRKVLEFVTDINVGDKEENDG